MMPAGGLAQSVNLQQSTAKLRAIELIQPCNGHPAIAKASGTPTRCVTHASDNERDRSAYGRRSHYEIGRNAGFCAFVRAWPPLPIGAQNVNHFVRAPSPRWKRIAHRGHLETVPTDSD